MVRTLFWLTAFAGIGVFAQNYKLGPSDLIKINVIEMKDMTGEYRVDTQGNVNLPYIGQFVVFHKTITEVRDELADRLSAEDLIKQPQVFVEILEVNWRPINVIGAVKTPGKLEKAFNISLVDAITRAGGVEENAGDTILVMRTSASGLSETLKISYEELLILGKPFLNIPIMAGDTINIPVEKPMLISVLGEINKPGEYEFKSNSKVTLLRVIAAAGGFTDFARRQKVAIRRSGKEEKVDVRKIQEDGATDFVMQDGDIVSVP